VEFLLRPYRLEDFQALYEIDQACFPRGVAYSKRMLRWYLAEPGAECIVAESGGAVAGFVLTARSGAEGHIITLDVLEPFRRQRIGTALLEAAERGLSAHGVSKVYLEMATTNAAAVAFWQKHGYRTADVLPGYYSNGDDAYEMSKTLTPAREC
jgi:ribosomal-protein-alanine N-acetyltransferase